MACPSENSWMDYLRESRTASRDELVVHLDTCATCRRLYANLLRDERTARAGERVSPELLFEDVKIDRLARGTLVGRYLIVDLVGRGGMGVVYKAFDPELDRTIALKLVNVQALGGASADSATQRMQREAQSLARLRHPNVVTVFDVGRHEESLFIAMEFVPGQTLREWLTSRRTTGQILGTFIAAGEGLFAAHQAGLVHRDFKPDNVMVDEDGQVRVLDFGLADAGPGALAEEERGARVGTPGYMAPEQREGHEVDARADQFSFCVSLFEALFQARPFAGEDGLGDELPEITGKERVGARVRRAVLRGLSRDPGDRHESVGALLHELRGRPLTRRSKLALSLAGLLLLVGAGLGARWMAATPDPCLQSGADIDAAWNAEREGRLRANLKLSQHPRAASIADGVVESADRWAASWRRERARVCRLTLARGEERDTVPADQVQCLERRLQSFDASLAVFQTVPDQAIVEAAERHFSDLAPPDECAELASKTMSRDAKEDATASVEALVKAQLALSRGQLSDAAALADAAVKLGRDKKDGSLLASLLIQGQVRSQLGKHPEARASFRECIRLATRAKENRTALDAWLGLLRLRIAERELGPATDALVFSSEVAAERFTPAPDQLGKLHYLIGALTMMQRDLTKAREHLAKAVRAWDEAHMRQGVAVAELSLGMVQTLAGELEEADAVFRSAEEHGKEHKTTLADVLTARGLLNVWRHRFKEAEPFLERAAKLTSAAEAPGDRKTLSNALVYLSLLQARRGSCDEATSSDRRSLEALGDEPDGRRSAEAILLIGRARCALDEGRAARAIELLERAIATPADEVMHPLRLPWARFLLARAWWGEGARRRAVESAQTAAAALAEIPGAAADLQEVRAWLEQRSRVRRP